MSESADTLLRTLAGAVGWETYELYPLLAVVLVGLACGLVGSLVIGNRLAFFADAMAHTAFAGVSLSLLAVVLATGARQAADVDPYTNHVAAATALLGVLVGLAIAMVSEKTDLTHDTVIGVFFAASVGLAGMLLPSLRQVGVSDPDNLLFGSLVLVSAADIVVLAALAAGTALATAWCFNPLVLGTFNASLAKSRDVPVRAANYVFIVTLALVVNLCLPRVGILLINALLVVPGAAAANVARNLRQFFWFTVAGSVGCSVAGFLLSSHVRIPLGAGTAIEPRPGGAIVLTAVAWFFVSAGYRALRRGA